MEWFWLIAAIAMEVAGTTALKFSDGMKHLIPTVAMFALYLGSIVALSWAITIIPVGIAYAIWSGIGTAMIVVISVIWFGEPMSLLKLFFIGLIIVGAIGLNLTGSSH